MVAFQPYLIRPPWSADFHELFPRRQCQPESLNWVSTSTPYAVNVFVPILGPGASLACRNHCTITSHISYLQPIDIPCMAYTEPSLTSTGFFSTMQPYWRTIGNRDLAKLENTWHDAFQPSTMYRILRRLAHVPSSSSGTAPPKAVDPL